MINAPEISSTRPYLIRAIHEWCIDNGFTPYIVVSVNDSVQVPREFVKDGEIVLNASYDATSSLQLGNDFIEFKARFGGVAREIMVPVGRVIAVYARENGQGMAFPPPVDNLDGSVSQDRLPSQMDGLASASAPTDATTERPVPQLVPVGGAQGNNEDFDEDSPPPKPPAGGGGARPSLKLVK
ncbi:ClpXP protease specificity-enhancing factor [Diaphorobacter aerolatus]|uniref:ClpXP protease specificity-enhancing factor n=1 Tax=Diaphorobacter aerolatus TaxID=1288495 RepID=A0A7H0GN52_9BURK|nr:ClpXP protease specificity-enhancing factor [Diaphorobacter aerolatus]QNP49718.1 ClpXP protease specificity-enhancing factor [Diaphorobacter aerolatus]